MEKSQSTGRSARLKVGVDATQKKIEVVDGNDAVIDRGVMISPSNTGMALMSRGGMSTIRQVSDRFELVTKGDSIPLEVVSEKASA
jgi:hypothetical protein